MLGNTSSVGLVAEPAAPRLQRLAALASHRALDWLRCSGIQSEKAVPGAISAWYDPQSEQYAFYYPEVAGYAVTAHLWSTQALTARADAVRPARAAADWLIASIFDPWIQRFPYRYDHPTGSLANLAFTFDNGMILNGLANAYRQTGHGAYLNRAFRTAQTLVVDLGGSDGAPIPYRTWAATTPTPPQALKWSRQPGPYLAKCALGLLNLAQLDDDPVWSQAARRICDWAMTFKQDSGLFVVNPRANTSPTHPLCYVGEGLFVAGLVLDEPEYLDAAAGIASCLLQHQLPDGGIPRAFRADRISTVPERTDALAQTIRLAVLAMDHGLLDPTRFLAPIEAAVERLLTYQSHNEDRRQHGGFAFGFQADGRRCSHINAWCTMFAAQALWLYSQHGKRRPAFNPFWLT